METVKSMNGTLWLFAALLIIWVLVQAGLFVRLALSFNKKNNLLTSAQLKDCMKIGGTAVIGPAVNAIAVCLTMVGMLGSADTFMRCGVIGAPAQELYLAQMSAVAAGVDFGTDAFTPAIFTFCIIMQVWGSIPFFVHTCISLQALDLAVNAGNKDEKKKGAPTFMNFMGDAAMFCVMSYMLTSYTTAVDKIACMAASFVAAIIVDRIVKKTGSRNLASFSMVISMVFGMIAGQVVFQMLPA